jgi:extracellular matrix protein 14
MQPLHTTLSLLFVLLVICTPFPTIGAPGRTGDKIHNQFATLQPHRLSTESPRSLWRGTPQLSWLKGTWVEKYFRSPSKITKSVGEKPATQPSNSKLPAKLLAHYGRDVVLRFNISTPYEEQMLADAADHLLLDVWEFTSNWADIRLGEDVVCPRYPFHS